MHYFNYRGSAEHNIQNEGVTMEKDVIEIMSHFNNPMMTKIVIEDDDVLTLPDENHCKIDISEVNFTNPYCKNLSNIEQSHDKNTNGKNTSNGVLTVDKILEIDSESRSKPRHLFDSVVMSNTNNSQTNPQNAKPVNINNPSIQGTEKDTQLLNRVIFNNKKTILKQYLDNDNYCNINSLPTPNSINISNSNNKSANNNIPDQANEQHISSNGNSTSISNKRKRPNASLDQDFINLPSSVQLVSEHLLHIIKYQIRYTVCWGSYLPLHYLEHINKKKHFVKCYFFKLCYSVTLLILIPEENNEIFKRNFIDGTIKLSQLMNVDTSYDEITKLYSEMLEWTKKEKILINQSIERLAQFDPPSYATHRMSIQPYEPSSYQVSGQEQTMPQEVNQIRSSLDDQRKDLQTLYINQTRPMTTLPNCAQQLPAQIPNIQVSTIVPNWAQQVSVIQQDRPQLSTFQQETTSTSTQEQLSVMRDRSISRDSGIASPSSNVQHNSFQKEFQNRICSEFNPKIFSVCSIPEKRKRPCHVCSKITTKMCLGCFTVYYCSLPCQKKDYHQHKFVCKRNV